MSSVLSISVGGMNAAMQRLQTSASNIANSSSAEAGSFEQDIMELTLARIEFEANARVAQMVAKTVDRLLDIKV